MDFSVADVNISIKPLARVALTKPDIVDTSIFVDQPGGDCVVVVDGIHAAFGLERIDGRLHIAGLVHRPRLHQQLFAIPFKRHGEAGQALVEDRAMKLSRFPVAAAIKRNIDANDLAPTRPREAAQLMDPFF